MRDLDNRTLTSKDWMLVNRLAVQLAGWEDVPVAYRHRLQAERIVRGDSDIFRLEKQKNEVSHV